MCNHAVGLSKYRDAPPPLAGLLPFRDRSTLYAMPEIVLLCGLPGSGKSTWAAARALRGAMVFNSDQWMLRLYGPHMSREVFDARLAACFGLICEQTNRLTALGIDVVIDGVGWKREQRRLVVERLAVSGAALSLLWFDVPPDELRRRLVRRNAALPPDTFEITDAMLTEFAGWFEPPTEAEGLRVVRVG